MMSEVGNADYGGKVHQGRVARFATVSGASL